MIAVERKLTAQWRAKRDGQSQLSLGESIHINSIPNRWASIPPRDRELDAFLSFEMKSRGYAEYEQYIVEAEAQRLKENLRREFEKFAFVFIRSNFNPDGSVRNHDRIREELKRRERDGVITERGMAVLKGYRDIENHNINQERKIEHKEKKRELKVDFMAAMFFLFILSMIIYQAGVWVGAFEGRPAYNRVNEWSF